MKILIIILLSLNYKLVSLFRAFALLSKSILFWLCEIAAPTLILCSWDAPFHYTPFLTCYLAVKVTSANRRRMFLENVSKDCMYIQFAFAISFRQDICIMLPYLGLFDSVHSKCPPWR